MNADIKIYDKKPDDFASQIEVAAIYVSVKDRILLLQLADHKAERGTWGIPGGKVEVHEKALHAAKRELFEETGIHVESTDLFHSLGALYVRKPEVDYILHLFGVHLDAMPDLSLSGEHCSHKWVVREEAETLPLMNGGKQALDAYYQLISKKSKRTGASVCVYLVLVRKDEVLLSLRKNTGYHDGYYSLVAGHVEDGESAMNAMIREAYEEASIHIHPSCLKVVHVMHRQSNRFNIDIFFMCDEWEGDIANREPEKCAALTFFPISQLPANSIDYIGDALRAIAHQQSYSERGW